MSHKPCEIKTKLTASEIELAALRKELERQAKDCEESEIPDDVFAPELLRKVLDEMADVFRLIIKASKERLP